MFPVTSETIRFQLLMVCAGLYYSMLLTNWGNPVLFGESAHFFDRNNTSYWCQLAAMWTSMFVYLVSLFQPLIFKNRSI